eukprot:3762140-Pleurochrysis_carterae.AAC.1
MAKAQPVPRPERGLLARARNARRADGLRERSGLDVGIAGLAPGIVGGWRKRHVGRWISAYFGRCRRARRRCGSDGLRRRRGPEAR